MALCDTDCYHVILLRCRVSMRNLISVFCVVPKIWFSVDGNASAKSKNMYMSTTRQKTSKQWNAARAVF